MSTACIHIHPHTHMCVCKLSSKCSTGLLLLIVSVGQRAERWAWPADACCQAPALLGVLGWWCRDSAGCTHGMQLHVRAGFALLPGNKATAMQLGAKYRQIMHIPLWTSSNMPALMDTKMHSLIYMQPPPHVMPCMYGSLARLRIMLVESWLPL